MKQAGGQAAARRLIVRCTGSGVRRFLPFRHAGRDTSETDTHVESCGDVLSDAGSTPAASTILRFAQSGVGGRVRQVGFGLRPRLTGTTPAASTTTVVILSICERITPVTDFESGSTIDGAPGVEDPARRTHMLSAGAQLLAPVRSPGPCAVVGIHQRCADGENWADGEDRGRISGIRLTKWASHASYRHQTEASALLRLLKCLVRFSA